MSGVSTIYAIHSKGHDDFQKSNPKDVFSNELGSNLVMAWLVSVKNGDLPNCT